MIEFSDQLSQDNWYLTLATNVLTTYIIRLETNLESNGISG